MIDVTAAMVALLKSDAEISALVGDRVISDVLPQGFAMPAVVLWINSGRAHDALSGGALGMDQPVFRIECYGRSRVDAADLRLKIRNFITGYFGTISDVFIQGIAQENGTRDRTDRVRTGTDEYRFAAYQDFRVSYRSIGEPIFSVQPENASVTAPDTATFTCYAGGGGVSYQWELNTGAGWSDVPGATSNIYETPPTSTGDNGDLYRCKATNAAGTATSKTATLTVT